MKKKDTVTDEGLSPREELSPEEQLEAERLRRKRVRRRKAVVRFIDRFFGLILVTGIIFCLAGLGLEYVLVKGPSPSLKEAFVMTMLETRRFTFIPNVFLSEEEIEAIKEANDQKKDVEMDLSLIQMVPEEPEEGTDPRADAYGCIDEDGDGILYEDIMGPGYVGYLITVLDPTRVFVGMPNGYGGVGLTLEEMCQKYDALGGINAGGFVDDSGGGMGGMPQGLTIIDGVWYNTTGSDSFAGLDANGVLHIGYFTQEDIENLGIVSGVSFSPVLILNGEEMPGLGSGVNPRTAIAQRGDGAIMMLVIDGRQLHSAGAMYTDVVDILLDHGAVNACNMDGGSSTTMYLNGAYVNKCSSANGIARPLPNAFLFK